MGAAVAILYADLFLYPKEKKKSKKKKLKKKKSKKNKKLEKNENDINEIIRRGWKDKIKYLVIDSSFTNLFEMLQGNILNL